MNKAGSVDEYIAGAPANVQPKLEQLRQIVKEVAPEAQEKISYGIPYYSLNGRLVYFGYFKNHINLTIMIAGVEKFKSELSDYETGKGSVNFQLDKPLPLPLIKKIIKQRTEEQRSKNKRP